MRGPWPAGRRTCLALAEPLDRASRTRIIPRGTSPSGPRRTGVVGNRPIGDT